MNKTVVLGLTALTLGAAVTIGVVSAYDGDNSDVRPVQVGRLTEMEQTGEMHRVLERHRQMLEQMQDEVSPAMLQRMNDDPMWLMMKSENWARMDEQHQADIDRMMGKGQP